ncbi:uncharacterized protein ISCGN_029409 [Ixodes scapularis]
MAEPKKVFFSENEKFLLAELVPKYPVIENRCTNKSSTEARAKAWELLTIEYNSNHGVRARDSKQLKKCWDNLKTKWKKEVSSDNRDRIATGGGPPGAGLSQLSVLVGAAAPHMARRLVNGGDSDGRHAGQALFSVADILEPMVVQRADEELSLEGFSDSSMGEPESQVSVVPSGGAAPMARVPLTATVQLTAAAGPSAAASDRQGSPHREAPTRVGGRFGVLERTLGAEQDVRLGHLTRDQERKDEEHDLRLKILKAEHEMRRSEHKLKMKKIRNENRLVLLRIAEAKKLNR